LERGVIESSRRFYADNKKTQPEKKSVFGGQR
jgi:hypothetical protein